jgi:hypothetical protein
MQIKKWQTRAFNRCAQILRGEDGAQIKMMTLELIAWGSRDGWEHQAFGADLNLDEESDPLQLTLKD